MPPIVLSKVTRLFIHPFLAYAPTAYSSAYGFLFNLINVGMAITVNESSDVHVTDWS